MKFTEFLEGNVVDLATFQKKKTQQVSTKQDQQEIVETHAWMELGDIEEWKYKLSRHNRVPGFDDIDDVLYFVAMELRFPENQEDVEDWFSHITEKNRAKALMIVHHAPRMIRVCRQILEQIKLYVKRWKKRVTTERLSKEPDAVEAAQFFEFQIQNDINQLERIGKIVDFVNK